MPVPPTNDLLSLLDQQICHWQMGSSGSKYLIINATLLVFIQNPCLPQLIHSSYLVLQSLGISQYSHLLHLLPYCILSY